jgi:transcriptional regulator
LVYLPPVFTESRHEVLIAHIERHDFGLLISQGESAPTASHVPFLVAHRDGRLLLQAHLARPNPQLAELDRAGEALAIFQGPHAYVSPSWYTVSPAVPTWNYAAVHAYGRVRTIADADWLREFVRRLSERHEAREPALPWQIEALPEAYLASMLKGIVGVEIEVGRLEGKFKLSQNRPAADRARIITALEAREDAESRDLAALMRRREPQPETSNR